MTADGRYYLKHGRHGMSGAPLSPAGDPPPALGGRCTARWQRGPSVERTPLQGVDFPFVKGEAQNELLGRRDAVKMISLVAGGGSHGAEARARFLREASITARLPHPNIVTIHDLGETDTGDNRPPFLVAQRP
ncbi:protein kinase family protein [Streptomyces violascens]|uniref:hypothetical protein n=1 Tax=Streptomyces violascens TaxID=67381 RepID=UPI0036862249